MAALRVLKCSQGFEVKCANVSDLYEKSFKKGTLKQKIEKWPLLPIFYCLCSDICRGKNRKFQSK